MDGVKFSEIGKYKLTDLSQYFYGHTKKSFEITKKKIRDISKHELLYLLKQRIFTELALILTVEIISKNGFQGYIWHNDDNSEWERDTIKELILLYDGDWLQDPISFKKISPIISETARYHIHLQSFIIDHFLSLNFQEIILTTDNIEKLKEWIADDSASSVHAAYSKIRWLTRAIDNGQKVIFKTDNRDTTQIYDRQTLIDKIVSLLPWQDKFVNVVQREVKIER
ncbi:MAG: hypothetical protein K6U09_12560 [Acidobacteriia bacterium]|nr:hypothetical protein [Terriglobia bacterium]